MNLPTVCASDESFLAYTDGLADADVIYDVQRLNSDIHQLAAAVSDRATIAVDAHWPTICWPRGLNLEKPVISLFSRALQSADRADVRYILQIILQSSWLGAVEDWTQNLSQIYQYDLETGY